MHKISYIADGDTAEFDFAFPFFQAADIHVAFNEVVLSADEYSVVENPSFDGGRIVFNTAPASETRIDIYRMVALSRTVDYQPTAKIDPEHLNADFNFLIEALKDLHAPNVDIETWRNTHTNVINFLEYTNSLVQDKLTGGGVLGLYTNLLMVLNNALPNLINDYGYITDTADTTTCDDYGLL